MLKRVAVFVSGGGTNLQALLDAAMPSVQIALVIASREGVFALERARRAGVPAFAIAERGEVFEQRATALLVEHRIDVVVLAGFLRILSEAFIRGYEGRMLNIHPALIPSFCGKGFYGLRVHEAVLARGVKITGATVHLVNEIPDGGEILAQKAVEVRAGDTPETLQQRVMQEAEWIILPEAVEAHCARLCREEERK